MLLGLDLGTTKAKAIVIKEDGKILSNVSSESYKTISPNPSWAEQKPEAWWKAVKKVAEKALQKSDAERIDALGLSGQMHGAVPVNKNGNPIGRAIIWCDRRAKEETTEIKEKIPDITEITGNPPVPEFQGPKLLWLKKNKPSLIGRTHKVLFPKDFIDHKLTGSLTTDFSDASGSLLFDIREEKWAEEVLDSLKIPLELLPKIVDSTTVTGTVSKEFAESTGVEKDTKVIKGGADLATSVMGSGLIRTGDTAADIGTAARVLSVSEDIEEAIGKVYVFFHVLKDKKFLMGTIPAGGRSLEWFKETIEENGKSENVYQSLDSEAGASSPTETPIFLPYLLGTGNPHLEPGRKGAFLEITDKTSRGELARAVMEGVAFGLRESLDIFEKEGVKSERIKFVGGGSEMSSWKEILANVFGREVVFTRTPDSSPLGAALIGGVGAGEYGGIEEAVQAIKEGKVTEPDDDKVELYNQKYKRFKVLRSEFS